MAVEKIRLGTNEDGSPQWLFRADNPDDHIVITGPITGTVTLPGGKIIDVTDPIIAVGSPKEAALVSNAIAQRFVEEGHPSHEVNIPFEFEPSVAPSKQKD